MRKLIVATSNPGKLQEMQEYLIGLNWELSLKPPEIDVEETGKTFLENAILKASQVAKALGEWAIADDSGLVVEALNGAPGLYSARYGDNDQARIERVLKELGNTHNRQAKFVCAIAMAKPNGSIALQTEGICQGEILKQPQGVQGFGYDPIFYVPRYQQTFAQMTPTLKRDISHRGQAFSLLLPQLSQL
ncbi:MAG: RdgB/HAM1 family non-canonical purine NTP pyrophosphatase [Crocosphaera sp.]|nr:RdgB/HAM1 family non-canonical purine NTP pyrophosphatase [Crocosphaera sp.]